jgi:hypothetical protein
MGNGERLLSFPMEERAEGITSGPGSSLFVSQIVSGRVLELDILTGNAIEVVGEQPEGQQAWGLEYFVMDGAGYLVVAGGGPSYGTGFPEAYLYDVNTGESLVACQPLSVNETGLGAFINDVTIVDDVAYLTNSFSNQLMVMSLPEARNGFCEISKIPLPSLFVPSSTDDWGANGIEAYGSGLLISHEKDGSVLFMPNVQSTVYYEIISNAPGADGLTVVNDRLYVTQNTENSIAVYELAFNENNLLEATKLGVLTTSLFDTPATSAVYEGYVYSTNSRFGSLPDLTDVGTGFGVIAVQDIL